MRKIDFFIGFVIGLAACFLGTYLYITLIAKYEFFSGLTLLKNGGYLGKVITLGAILPLIAFFVLLKFNKDFMARGVILATIVLAILTIFI